MEKFPANLTVYTGPMYSGKTGEMIKSYRELSAANFAERMSFYKFTTERLKNPVEIDIQSRDYQRNVAGLKGHLIHSLSQLQTDAMFLFFDEIHFFNLDEKELFFEITAGKQIFMAGVNLDWRCRPFESTGFFMCLADKIVKLEAFCDYCGNKAVLSEKITSGEERFDEYAGYKPICKLCRFHRTVE